MKVLGVHSGHNASACILVDGKIETAIQEERLNRVKNFTGFPELAVKFVLDQAGITIAEVDKVAYTDVYRIIPEYYMNRELTQVHFSKEPNKFSFGELRGEAENIKSVGDIVTKLRVRRRAGELASYGMPKNKLYRVEHHTSHAASAYYGWGKFSDPVLVLTCDGSGDGISATVSVGENGKLKRIASVSANYSIGLIYALTTLLLGMKPNEHEYKLMGMAPYAHKEDGEKLAKKFSAYFELDPSNSLGWRTTKEMPNTYWAYQRLRKDLEFERFDAICAGLQLWTEIFLADWVVRCIKQTGIRQLALSGGVFMNVKANKRIMELNEVDDLFVFPSCGDETNPIGSCYLFYAEQKGVSDLEPLGPIYWGKEFTEVECENAIKKDSRNHQLDRPVNMPGRIARLIAEGEVVARFAGRDEFGARALGNRSILADPSRTEVIRVINDMIKNRDFWMPFACSIEAERANDYLINPKGIMAPYMIMTFDTTELRSNIIAGLHPYDLTVRPQVVYRDHNPEYHQVITEFETISSIGAVLNTSFNLHGYPIVHTPSDALDVFNRSGLKYLALGPYLVYKS